MEDLPAIRVCSFPGSEVRCGLCIWPKHNLEYQPGAITNRKKNQRARGVQINNMPGVRIASKSSIFKKFQPELEKGAIISRDIVSDKDTPFVAGEVEQFYFLSGWGNHCISAQERGWFQRTLGNEFNQFKFLQNCRRNMDFGRFGLLMGRISCIETLILKPDLSHFWRRSSILWSQFKKSPRNHRWIWSDCKCSLFPGMDNGSC